MADPFYSDAKRYWENTPATVNGMLGGFGYISDDDISGSRNFLLSSHADIGSFTMDRALDCGSGIGRVTKHLLLPLFKTVDMVDVNKQFLDQAKEYIGPEYTRVGEQFCSGLQDFAIKRNHYQVIWCQWVLGHLTDEDLKKFFQRCIDGLQAGGVILIKENVSSSDEAEFDDEDSSYTRPREMLVQLFEESGLEVLRDDRQEHFPDGIFEVRMFALRPKS